MSILEYFKKNNTNFENSITREEIINLQSEALNIINHERSDQLIENEANQHSISFNDYKMLLKNLLASKLNPLNFFQIIQLYNKILPPIDILRQTRNTNLLAFRFGNYEPGPWLMLMNSVQEQDFSLDSDEDVHISKPSSFVHELFKNNKAKELILDYFNLIKLWTKNQRQLLRNYLDLYDNNGKTIIDILRSQAKTEKYFNIDNEVFYNLELNDLIISTNFNVNNHTASIHQSADQSFVQLALNLNLDQSIVVRQSETQIEINRDKTEWTNFVREYLFQLQNQFIQLSSSDYKFDEFFSETGINPEQKDLTKFKIQKSLELVNEVISQEKFGINHIIHPRKINSCGLTIQEIFAISFWALLKEDQWINQEKFSSRFSSFINCLFAIKRGYNFDIIENNFIKLGEDEDLNICQSGMINQIAFDGLRGNININIKIINAQTLLPALKKILPTVILEIVQSDLALRNDFEQFLQSKILSSNFKSKLYNNLLSNQTLIDEFGENNLNIYLNNSLSLVDFILIARKISLLDRSLELIPKEHNDNITKFYFDDNKEHQIGKGFILYLYQNYQINYSDTKKLLTKILQNFFDLPHSNNLVIINLVLYENDPKFRADILEILQSLGRSNLHKLINCCIKSNYNQLAKCILELSIDINLQDIFGNCYLYQAVVHQNIELVRILLEKGIDPNLTNREERSPLHEACSIGNYEIVKLLVQYNADVNLLDDFGISPFFEAIANNNSRIIELMLPLFGDINSKFNDIYLPIHYAALKGSTSALKLLIMYGAEINAASKEGIKALHYAALQGHNSIIQVLFNYGVNINDLDCNKNTALHHTSIQGHIVSFKLLLKLGADINLQNNNGFFPYHIAALHGRTLLINYYIKSKLQIDHQTNLKQTALHLAVESRHYNTVELLIQQKFNIDHQDCLGRTPLILAASYGRHQLCNLIITSNAKINLQDLSKKTALHYAVEYGCETTTKLLLSNQAGTNIMDKDGLTALHIAAMSGKLNLIKTLLPYSNVNQQNKYGITPLHFAVRFGNNVLIEELLKNGANINQVDNDGFSVLHFATKLNKYSTLKLLLKYNPDLSIKDREFNLSAFEFAVIHGFQKSVELFISHGVNINNINTKKKSALHHAVSTGHSEILKILLTNGAALELQDIDGKTPLLIAAKIGNEEILKILLDSHANINAKDSNGKTALHIAASFGYMNIVKLLLQYNANTLEIDNDGRTALVEAQILGKSEIEDLIKNHFKEPSPPAEPRQNYRFSREITKERNQQNFEFQR